MESSGYFVSSASELSSGMKNCENNLDCGNARLMVDSHRDSASVITYRHGVPLVNGNFYMIAGPGKSLVYRVVHDLINEMMETS